MLNHPAAEDTLIVGAGPIGLACAISARRRGIDPLVIDRGAIVDAITHYPVGMTFFTTPELLEIGGHPLVCSAPKPTREEALMYYRGIVRTEGLRVRTYTRLRDVTVENDGLAASIETRLGTDVVRCRRLVLATGYFHQPNRLGVPGEDLPHVRHHFDEPHLSCGLDVVVVGGGNSAAEAALELFRAGARTTIVHRRPDFKAGVKYWVKPDIANRIKAGEIAAHMETVVSSIDARTVTLDHVTTGEQTEVPADRVYALIGFRPDTDLFRRIGIGIDDANGRPQIDPDSLETNVPGVYMAGSITAGYATSEIFIENGRFDGEKIFGSEESKK